MTSLFKIIFGLVALFTASCFSGLFAESAAAGIAIFFGGMFYWTTQE